MTRTVVVLGAGQVGLPIAHYLLRRTAERHPDLRVVLVSPHDTFYWKIASVRFALPDQMGEDRYMYPLAEQFAAYPPARFELVVGAAEALDPERNVVGVRVGAEGEGKEAGGGELREIEYHTLIVATGSRYRDDMPWKELGSSAQTRAAIAGLRAAIRDARSIVVAGAGLTGVEFAGELGSAYGKAGLKEITLVGADTLPLEKQRLKQSVRETAKHELEKLGVKYIGGAKVTTTKTAGGGGDDDASGTVTLTRADGTAETLAADLVVPAAGVVPNTAFAPASMRGGGGAAPGLLRQAADLRSPGHDNVFVLGDAGDLQPAQAAHADAQARHLMTQFDAYFAGRPVRPYAFDPSGTRVAFTVGRDRGTGQVGSWQLWSIVVWWLKGRHLGTDTAAAYARGDAGGMGKAWPA
ncbi:putative FAD binding protein [Xylaria palmicola]|nr:putative FAD binding protein [Xylaria palmicola]